MTYPSPKAQNPTASKTIPLTNTTFVLSLLLCGCEVDVGKVDVGKVDVVDVGKVDIITKRY